jgi:Na+:H+ antiporter, NhaA family
MISLKYLRSTTSLFTDFFESEKSSGIVLILCTVISLLVSNSAIGVAYIQFWNLNLAGLELIHWINDGLMAIFFLLIGLELERELYKGELSKLKDALLPVIAALGGMVVPAFIYFLINKNTPFQSGSGIPMATDIAFALAILSLLGSRVPLKLKIFLTALAVIDDLGAIMVIAIFYSQEISWLYLGIVGLIWAVLFVLNRLKIYNLIPYLIGGIVMWYYMHLSGIHASITGVILAFVIPFSDGSRESISYQLQKKLHFPVAFFILPLFALANTAIILPSDFSTIFVEKLSIGILFGLIIGKPLGIVLFSYIASVFKIIKLPKTIKWRHIIGVGCLGGIGFTMSIFISLLSFQNSNSILIAKCSILIASIISACFGFLLLKISLKSKNI